MLMEILRVGCQASYQASKSRQTSCETLIQECKPNLLRRWQPSQGRIDSAFGHSASFAKGGDSEG